MSYIASAAWSRPVSSPCYTEHGQRYGAKFKHLDLSSNMVAAHVA
jgi:hypothetical protein